jgi:hypothetical protein
MFYIQTVSETYGQALGRSSTYQNKKKCPYEHVPGNINLAVIYERINLK